MPTQASYTKTELHDLSLEKLDRLARYLKLGIPSKSRKKVYVDAIYDYLNPPTIEPNPEVEMSVRVKRIKQSQGE